MIFDSGEITALLTVIVCGEEISLIFAANDRFELVDGLLLKVPSPPLLLLALTKLKCDESENNDMVEFILGDLLNVLSKEIDDDSWSVVPGSLDRCWLFDELLLLLLILLLFADFLILFFIAARAHNSNASARLPAEDVFEECSSGNFALVSI